MQKESAKENGGGKVGRRKSKDNCEIIASSSSCSSAIIYNGLQPSLYLFFFSLILFLLLFFSLVTHILFLPQQINGPFPLPRVYMPFSPSPFSFSTFIAPTNCIYPPPNAIVPLCLFIYLLPSSQSIRQSIYLSIFLPVSSFYYCRFVIFLKERGI